MGSWLYLFHLSYQCHKILSCTKNGSPLKFICCFVPFVRQSLSEQLASHILVIVAMLAMLLRACDQGSSFLTLCTELRPYLDQKSF